MSDEQALEKGSVIQRTLELHLQPGPTTKDCDRRVVTLVHERAEHGTCRGTVGVPDYGAEVRIEEITYERGSLPMAILLPESTQHVSRATQSIDIPLTQGGRMAPPGCRSQTDICPMTEM